MMDKEIVVDCMRPEDLSRVYEIEQTCFSSSSWQKEDFQAALAIPEQHYVVARQGNELLGFAALYIMVDVADLVNIAVDPMYRRKGVGKCLMEALLAKARDSHLTEMTLEVRSSNQAAINLYKHFGFEKLAVRRDYYKSPVEDADIMQKHFYS